MKWVFSLNPKGLYPFLILLLLCFSTVSCSINKKTLSLPELKGYNSSYEDSMLLLTFEISKIKKKEKAELINAQIASGKLKNLQTNIHGSHIIKTIIYYSNTDSLVLENEHPLHREIEIPNIDGSIEKGIILDTKGTLFIRIQQKTNLDKLVLFRSEKFGKDEKIYELKFKP